jgi:hypothetical protein
MHKVITGDTQLRAFAVFTSAGINLVSQSDTHTHRLYSVKDRCLNRKNFCKISRFALQTSLRLQQRGRTIPTTLKPVNTSRQRICSQKHKPLKFKEKLIYPSGFKIQPLPPSSKAKSCFEAISHGLPRTIQLHRVVNQAQIDVHTCKTLTLTKAHLIQTTNRG